MGRLKLFGDSPDDDVSKIEINHEFAKRYEHNKKREELQRYEELKKQGRISSDSDSDGTSSGEEEPSKKIDFEFFDALIKIKNQDPILKNKDAKLFGSEDEGGGSGDEREEKGFKKKRREKPMYLKDVVSKQLIEDGPEFDDEEMEDGEEKGSGVKSYVEEQEELRREFLRAVEEGGDEEEEGDFLKVKEDSGGKDEGEDEIGGKLDEYFGEDEKLDEETMFLKDYFRNRMWLDNNNNNGRSKDMGDEEIKFSEDEEEIERQEDYERDYNFRFEENVGDRVMGHSRKVEGSVRKKDNARKSQRERKEERMTQAEFERKEELKRLKNLKKKEINHKLEKIREVAGFGKDEAVVLDEDDLEEEFDPEAYDKKMKEAFGDGYYHAEDVDPEFGSDEDEDEKPDFDKEDELLGLSKGWDEVNASAEGFKSTRERLLKDRIGNNGDENEIGEDGDDEPKEGKRKRKRKPSEVEKAVRKQLMEEYYKLDYEDTVGDLKTRFKYKPVKAKRFGLTPEELVMIEEKELNQYVSLKKIAPYRDIEWKVPRIKTLEFKKNIRKSHSGGSSDSISGKRKEKMHDVEPSTDNALEKERSNGDTSTLSRMSKRKRNQAKLKLRYQRIMAYGKIPSKSKSKNK